MKTIATLLLLILASASQAQFTANSTCANAIQICFDNPVAYPATIGAGAATDPADYGCLGSENNPAWFYFQVGTAGTHTLSITNSNNRDLDFILYGPFQNSLLWCDSLTAANTADCSYAGGATETVDFTSVNAGDYYVLLITNYSNLATNVSVTQTAGTGNFDCNFVAPCAVSLLTATPGTCDTLTNQYAVSGQLWTFNAPSSGSVNLNIGENFISFNAPFTNPINFTFTGLPSDGTSNTLSAAFSAASACTGSINFVAPSGCIPCDVTVNSNSPVCLGSTLELTASLDGATYSWTGPAGFNSNEQSPSIPITNDTLAGTYTVLVTGANCVSERSVDIEVLNVPNAEVIVLGNEICSGDILFLSAVSVNGATYSWTGPGGFSSNNRNTQINNAQTDASGDYIVSMMVGACDGGSDTLPVIVHDSPQITLYCPESVNPQNSPTVFYATGDAGLQYYWNFIGNTTLIDNVIYTSDRDTAIIFWDGGEGLMGMQVTASNAQGCFSESAQQMVDVTINTGLNPLGLNSLKVFPNPANAQTLVQLPEPGYTFYLRDALGKTREYLPQAPSTFVVSTTHLPSGIYFIEVEGKGQKYQSKLIVQH